MYDVYHHDITEFNALTVHPSSPPQSDTFAQVGFSTGSTAVYSLDQDKSANIRVRTPSRISRKLPLSTTSPVGPIPLFKVISSPRSILLLEFLTSEDFRTSSTSVSIVFERPFSTPPKIVLPRQPSRAPTRMESHSTLRRELTQSLIPCKWAVLLIQRTVSTFLVRR